MSKIEDIVFKEPLLEGIVVDRKNRFVVDVILGGKIHTCHCPSTGKIGNFDLKGRPCLLSKSNNKKRKTEYTMEAISLDEEKKEHKSWIGINQNATNKYVEHYLLQGAFRNMVGDFQKLKREITLGNSKIDFLMGDNVFLEVKTPIWRIDLPIPDYISTRDNGVFNSYDRLMKHLNSFCSCMQPHQKSILLVCFMYDHPGMKLKREPLAKSKLTRMFDKCSNLERWQVNFRFSKRGVKLIKYFNLDLENS